MADLSTDLGAELQSALGSGYTIQRELGGGGMSRVFVAHDHALDRSVVIKAVLPELASGVSAQRFAAEVHAAATLQHPHIVPVLSAGHTAREIPYYMMPYIRGETLRARLERGRIPFVEAVQFVGDVAKALSAAHEADVVHRDIKPDNILLSGGATVVTDFGIARAIHEARKGAADAEADAEPDARLTSMGTSLGTPAYMAPEQAAGGAIDARTDVYSWGVIVYETIVGYHPFSATTAQKFIVAHLTTAQKFIVAHLTERPVPLSHRATDTPGWFCHLVTSCMEKDPERRPADGAALVHAVEYGARGGLSLTASCTAAMRKLFGGSA
ncbi:MAG: serine/threonine-protein kinase [Gemmatimonadaceae bacterium]